MSKGRRENKNVSDEEPPGVVLDKALDSLQKNVITAPLDWHPQLKLVSITPLPPERHSTLVKWPLLQWRVLNGTQVIETEFTGPVKVSVPPNCTINDKQAWWIIRQCREYVDQSDIPNEDLSILFDDVRSKVGYYWYHQEEGWYDVITAYIFATYFFPVFHHFPILVFQGIKSSGKTTALKLLNKLCWNPTGISCNFSTAAMFRRAQDSRPTFFIDMARIDPANKQDVVDLLEAGTEPNGEVNRIGEDGMTVQTFRVYCPKIIAVREDLPFTDKTIRVITTKAPSWEYSLKHNILDGDKTIDEAVNKLLLYQWNAGNDVYHEYQKQEPDAKLHGRPFDYVAPLLAIVSFFAPERYDDFRSFIAEKVMNQETADLRTDVEDAILAILLEFEGETMEFRLMDLTKKVQEQLEWVKNYKIVQSALNNLGIVIRSHKTSRGVIYVLDLKKAREIAAQRGISRNAENKTEE